MQLGYTGEGPRPGGAPEQAAEAMPSSQGDARAAGRGRRTRGGGGAPPWTSASCVGNLGITCFSSSGQESISALRTLGSPRAPVTERPSLTAKARGGGRTGVRARVHAPFDLPLAPYCLERQFGT
jgi:hypothetical protein